MFRLGEYQGSCRVTESRLTRKKAHPAFPQNSATRKKYMIPLNTLPVLFVTSLCFLLQVNSDLQRFTKHNSQNSQQRENCFFFFQRPHTTIPFQFLIPYTPLTPRCLASADPSSVFWSAAPPGVMGLAAYSWKWTVILLRGHFASRSGGELRKP